MIKSNAHKYKTRRILMAGTVTAFPKVKERILNTFYHSQRINALVGESAHLSKWPEDQNHWNVILKLWFSIKIKRVLVSTQK
jgi:hypothetical protein